MTDFATLSARARGLSTHLFSRKELESLASSGEVSSLARSLSASGRLTAPVGAVGALEALERAIRHTGTRTLKTLARWSAEQPAVLELFFAEEDRLSLRALFRGAVQGASGAARLAGLTPTPLLPERALAELARQATPRDLVGHLVVLGYPHAERLLPLTALAQPDAFALDLELLRVATERSLRAARAGDDNQRSFAAQRVDLANLQTALVLAGAARDFQPEACFVDGGQDFSLERFAAAASRASRAEATVLLRKVLADTPLASFVRHGLDAAPNLEGRALGFMLQRQQRAARLDPLGSAPVLVFLLKLQAQRADLLRLTRGVSLGMPPALLKSDLVTPWN